MKKIVLFTLFIFLDLTLSYSQELKATVTVDMEQLDFESRTYVMSLKSDLENYLNNQRFTDVNWEGPKIPIDISIYLSGGSKSSFSAQLILVSRRVIRGTDGEGTSVGLKILDKNWQFEYQSGAMLSYNPTRFNEFTSLIDFYVLMAIGYDFDTYGELDGNTYYDQAKQICQMGATLNKEGYSTTFAPGELTRYSLISEMTDPRYEDFRKLIFSYYVDGLDVMVNDKEKGMANLEAVIDQMAQFKKNKLTGPSVFLQIFFDAKALEISQIFKGRESSTVWNNLIYLDPTNTMLYQAAMQGKDN